MGALSHSLTLSHPLSLAHTHIHAHHFLSHFSIIVCLRCHHTEAPSAKSCDKGERNLRVRSSIAGGAKSPTRAGGRATGSTHLPLPRPGALAAARSRGAPPQHLHPLLPSTSTMKDARGAGMEEDEKNCFLTKKKCV